ncbi:MAG: branched-chain amino acid ABC transporter substrate-binding protein [Thermoanaerobaculia bacterium]|nr:branched-chain amino acid ABC transporter substrate-binding protein [Thermoanaerobaculia bacterium]
MIRRPHGFIAILAMTAIFLLGCPPDTVKVAAVLPLTGEAAGYGEAVRRGIELANEEIQSQTDRQTPLVISFVDTGSDPEKASEQLTEQFGQGNIIAIGGVTSGEAKQMIEVIDRYDKPLLSPSASSPELTGISRNFYRIFPSDHTAANKMAQSAFQDLEIETIVIIAEEQPYAQGVHSVFKPAFEAEGGEVLELVAFPPGTSDLEALVEHAVSFKPDAVYLAGYADGIGSMIQELRRKRFRGKILTTSAFATSQAIAKVGEAASGVYLTQTVFEPDSEYAHVQKFVNAYQSKFGETPDIYAAHGYDALLVVAAAAEGRAPLPDELKKGLRDEVKEFPGVTGSIQFDEKGDVRKYPRLYKIGNDLVLIDYNEQVRRQQEEIRKRREALQKQLEELQRKARSGG